MRKCLTRALVPLSAIISAAVGLGSLSSQSFAQSQFPVVGQANGSSAQANVEAFQRDMIESHVLGSQSPNTLGPAAIGGARFRSTSHNGFTNTPQLFPPATVTYGADIKEKTVFAAGSIGIPGTIFGGRMRVGMLAGETTMQVEAKPNQQIKLPIKGEIGSADVHNTIVGGNVIWSAAIGYVSVAGLYTRGETEMVDKFICCIGQVYNEKHDGWTGSLVAGRVFPLMPGPEGLRLDLRGGLGYTKVKGDPFDALAPPPFLLYDQFKYSSSSVSFSPMLFADYAVAGVNLRPYAQATFKKLFNYSNGSQLSGPGVVDPGTVYDEARRFNTVEFGLSANAGNWSFNASIYNERSRDTETIGSRLGVSYNFN